MIRLLPIIVILALVLSGCATTHGKARNEQMESRITELEKNIQAKDAEIVDLQYQLKDLSSKVDTSRPSYADAMEAEPTVKASSSSGSSAVIRVKVSPEKVQRALKAAGLYNGAIDGKIGPGTKEAIIEFQKSHGLKSDGVLGKKTWEALKTYLK